MKRAVAIFLQTGTILIGLAVLVFMLWVPQVEGRNAHATSLFEIYFTDPFLAYAYIASIPFFMALYQAFKVLGYMGQKESFSQLSIKALRTIKRCGLTMIGFVVGGLIWIMLHESDDRAGGVAMGVMIALATIVATATAARLERRLKKN